MAPSQNTPASNTFQAALTWLALLCLALAAYITGLGGQNIPSNGDEMVYAHIAHQTALSGHWLPLASELENMRNTKPPLLFWQAMVAGDWGRHWTLAALRTPALLYTLAVCGLVVALMRRWSGTATQALLAGCVYLAFFSTFRYGRTYLTSAAETFWFGLPMFWLLALRLRQQTLAGMGTGRALGLHLLIGLAWGLGAAYKSFALNRPGGGGLVVRGAGQRTATALAAGPAHHRVHRTQRGGGHWHLLTVVRAGPGSGCRVARIHRRRKRRQAGQRRGLLAHRAAGRWLQHLGAKPGLRAERRTAGLAGAGADGAGSAGGLPATAPAARAGPARTTAVLAWGAAAWGQPQGRAVGAAGLAGCVAAGVHHSQPAFSTLCDPGHAGAGPAADLVLATHSTRLVLADAAAVRHRAAGAGPRCLGGARAALGHGPGLRADARCLRGRSNGHRGWFCEGFVDASRRAGRQPGRAGLPGWRAGAAGRARRPLRRRRRRATARRPGRHPQRFQRLVRALPVPAAGWQPLCALRRGGTRGKPQQRPGRRHQRQG